jgi:hypothetical protein
VPQVRGIKAINGRDPLQPEIESSARKSRTRTGKRRQFRALLGRRAHLIFMPQGLREQLAPISRKLDA